jgi:uncharacterized protein (UPF0333 family)
MKNIIGIILIIAGIFVFVQGFNRKDSLAGQTEKLGNSIANSVDGGARTSEHVWMMVGGGALVLVGVGALTRRTRI